ncbi:hypothetical protein EDD15DRAFT_5055 [Pisolithus albus]|nr:hypothetical protein EDD15DRAFT_5055 [Pisolithus albus]
MAIIPSLRTIVFAVVSLLALAVFGISIHLLFILGLPTPSMTFTAFGLAAGCVTIVSLPLFFILGHAIRGACTSTVIFEIIWFFSLWVLWVATAGSTIVDRASNFPSCAYYTQEICYEITVLEVLAFINFFATFFYHDVLFLYAIVCAIRGRRIWTMSVRDAANGGPYTPAIVMTQPPYLQQVAPQYPQYPGFPVQQYSGQSLHNNILESLNNNTLASLNNMPTNNSLPVSHKWSIPLQFKITTLPTCRRWETVRFPRNPTTILALDLISHRARSNST